MFFFLRKIDYFETKRSTFSIFWLFSVHLFDRDKHRQQQILDQTEKTMTKNEVEEERKSMK